MKQFNVPVRFIIEGDITVNAKSKEQAREYVEKHVGLCLGGNVHTSLSNDEIPDWDFYTHAHKKLGIITKKKK